MSFNKVVTLIIFGIIIGRSQSADVKPVGTIMPDPNADLQKDAQELIDKNAAEEIIMEKFPRRLSKDREEIYKKYYEIEATATKGRKKRRIKALDIKGILMKEVDGFRETAYVLMKGVENTFLIFLQAAFVTNYRDPVKYQMVGQILLAADVDRPKLIEDYEKSFGDLKHRIDTVRGNVGGFFLSLFHRKRAPDGPVVAEDVQKDVDTLLEEKPTWDTQREQLNTILIERSRAHVGKVLEKYAEANGGKILKDDISEKMSFDLALKDLYLDLIDVGQDFERYVARRIHDNVYEDNKYSTMTLFVVHYSESLLPKIKERFEQEYKISMRQYLLDLEPDYKALKLLADIIGD